LIIIAVFAAIILEYHWLVRRFSQYAYDSILDIKKKHLEDVVDNIIINLDERQEILRDANEGFSEEQIEEMLENDVRNWIYASEYNDASYIWINKVLNYDGGDDYGIRIIHANLKDTEGMMLSTNEEDSVGNKPYLVELEGIKKEGEIYQVYQFQKIDSDRQVTKLTFAKLYADYNWIICMGVDLEEVDNYVNQMQSKTRKLLFLGIILMELAVVLGFVLVLAYRRKQYDSKAKELISELNADYLTGAGSRRYGEWLLSRYCDECRHGNGSAVVAMLDIDYFKKINDTYGHEAGDHALQEFVVAISHVIKSQGTIIRWGGDEFVVILPNYGIENVNTLGKELIEKIQSIEIDTGTELITMTSSIGFTVFEETDEFYNDVMKRTDYALYMAKLSGRNRYKINLKQDNSEAIYSDKEK